MIRVDQQPISTTLPLPATQTENKSCCITNIALPIIAALAGFVFLPFEFAIVLAGVVAIGALLCNGCIDSESIKKVSTWMPRGSEREPGRIHWPSSESKTPVMTETEYRKWRSATHSGSAYEPSQWIPEHESVDAASSSRGYPGTFGPFPPPQSSRSHPRPILPGLPTSSRGSPEHESVDREDPSRLRPTPPMRRAPHPTADLHGNTPTPRPLAHAPHANRHLPSVPPSGPEREEVG